MGTSKRGPTDRGRDVSVIGVWRMSDRHFAKFWSDLALDLRRFAAGVRDRALSSQISQYTSLSSWTRLPFETDLGLHYLFGEIA